MGLFGVGVGHCIYLVWGWTMGLFGVGLNNGFVWCGVGQ